MARKRPPICLTALFPKMAAGSFGNGPACGLAPPAARRGWARARCRRQLRRDGPPRTRFSLRRALAPPLQRNDGRTGAGNRGRPAGPPVPLCAARPCCHGNGWGGGAVTSGARQGGAPPRAPSERRLPPVGAAGLSSAGTGR